MKTPNFFNRRALFFLAAFAFAFTLVLFITSYQKYIIVPERVVKNLEKSISISKQELTKEAELILSKLSNHDYSFQEFISNQYPEYFRKKGQIFLVYKDGMLSSWTDNSFPAPREFDSLLFSNKILNKGNGWFLVTTSKRGHYTVAGLQLLKYGYKYQNDYLPQSFYRKFSLPPNTVIHLSRKTTVEKLYEISSPGKDILFYISFNGVPRPGPVSTALLFLLITISLIFLIGFIFELYKALYSAFSSTWLLLGFYLDVLIIRGIQLYFKFPATLYDSDFFSPLYYASSTILPSLGDFLINAILVLQVAWFTFKGLGPHRSSTLKKPRLKYTVLIFGTLTIAVLFHFTSIHIRSLVINSNIHLGFDGLFRVSLLSLSGFSIIAAIIFSFLFFFYALSKWIYHKGNSPAHYLIAGTAVSALYAAFNLVNNEYTLLPSLVLAAVFITFYLQHRKKRSLTIKLSQTLLFVLILSVFTNFSLNRHNRQRELEKRKLMALHLTEYRDSMAEYRFGKVSNDILLDTKLIRDLRLFRNNSGDEENVVNYLVNNHFNGYWSKFKIQITLCYPGKNLEIKPNNAIVECSDYFNNLILNYGKQTSVSSLYFFDNALDMMYYTGRIMFEPSLTGFSTPFFIYVEIISKNNFFALGYPQLLLDKRVSEPDNLNDYSYAIYTNKDLVKSAGRYSYDIRETNILNKGEKNANFNLNGYNHQVFPIDKSSELIISHRNLTYSESIAPFSYIFLFLSVFMLFFHFISGRNFLIKRENITFGIRLQVALIGIILTSSVIFGTVTILNLVRMSESKNMETVREKMNSVRYELELILSDYQKVTTEDGNMLADNLDRIANTLFIDVNFFDTRGELLASSRSQIFEDNLISTQINPVSRYNVIDNHKSYYFHNETIGRYNFLSAYATIRNYDNKVIGIINLPYFSRQTEQNQELYNFLATFANTFIILIALAIFLALFISRYVTKPLQLIGSKLGNLQLGRSNAKIEWAGNDEIGSLVSEYNRMIDELGQKADLLAQSERESAWRQMARQVAHEIKNPLTPIKLSIQHLMRAWNDKAPDWEQRLNKFSQTLVMQIDTLSEIAAEFSDFAQMPEPAMRRFDIVPLLNHSISLFGNFSNITITFETGVENCYIIADENQILRVFNNLIKNAVQAIPFGREGNIHIKLIVLHGTCTIDVTDDGTGILPEQQSRIFSPNFTTKSAGMGLGLAMVKNIIDISGGRIWFESVPDNGTTFTVELPLVGE